MPRYAARRRALGEDVRVRILTYHHYIQHLPADPRRRHPPDLGRGRRRARRPRGRPQRRPSSPSALPLYAAAHPQALAGPGADWSGLTLLDPLRPNEGWATWNDWFALAGHPATPPRRIGLDSYTYVLEAAAVGTGIALGWRASSSCGSSKPARWWALVDGFVEFDRAYYGVLTEKGRRKPLARRCLDFFDLDPNPTASR